MKTILVDDEKKAIQVFQHMTEKIATIELEGIFQPANKKSRLN